MEGVKIIKEKELGRLFSENLQVDINIHKKEPKLFASVKSVPIQAYFTFTDSIDLPLIKQKGFKNKLAMYTGFEGEKKIYIGKVVESVSLSSVSDRITIKKDGLLNLGHEPTFIIVHKKREFPESLGEIVSFQYYKVFYKLNLKNIFNYEKQFSPKIEIDFDIDTLYGEGDQKLGEINFKLVKRGEEKHLDKMIDSLKSTFTDGHQELYEKSVEALESLAK